MKLHEQMPELEGATAWLNGKRTKSELLGKKPTLIHFWSVSCYLCKESMGDVNTFRDYFNRELNVIAIHMPRSTDDLDIAVIKENARKYDMRQPIIVDNKLTITDAFDNDHVPAYYVFDREGRLRHFQAGGKGMKMLKKRIQRLLDEARW